MKLLLVDISHVFRTKWHATAGQDVDASFRASYEAVVKMRTAHDAVVICCDSGRCFRHDLDPNYKTGRTPLEEAGKDQLRRLLAQLEEDGMPIASAQGFEADDVVATLAMQAASRDYEATIFSGDKDFCALVGPGVTVVSPTTGVVMDEAGVLTKFGVKPDQMTDFLSLVGDKSDGIKGAPGIGEVTARLLLNKLGSLTAIGSALQTEALAVLVTTKQHSALIESWASVLLARKLVALRLDAPVSLDEVLVKKEPTKPHEQMDEKGLSDEGGEKLPSLVQPTPAPLAKAEAPTAAPEPAQEPAALILDRQDPRWAMRLEPSTSGQAYKFAQAIYASQLYRKFPNAEAIFAVILRGRSMGIDMMTALDGFHVIEGKPTASSMLLVACVLNSGKAEYFELTETTNEKATWVTKRRGSTRELSLSFSIEDAVRAGLVRQGGNWTKHPRAMCRKQAGAELARAVYPDVCANVYTPEEMGGDDAETGRRVA